MRQAKPLYSWKTSHLEKREGFADETPELLAQSALSTLDGAGLAFAFVAQAMRAPWKHFSVSQPNIATGGPAAELLVVANVFAVLNDAFAAARCAAQYHVCRQRQLSSQRAPSQVIAILSFD